IFTCTILPPANAAGGTYVITGTTISNHWCNGDVTHDITGDQTIILDGPTPTPTLPCIHDCDVNADGELTAADAQQAFLIALGSMTPTWDEACAADCNGDGEITAGDAQLIFMAVLGSGNCVDPL
nr:dockerin type I repeat-containing protein [bacterium]